MKKNIQIIIVILTLFSFSLKVQGQYESVFNDTTKIFTTAYEAWSFINDDDNPAFALNANTAIFNFRNIVHYNDTSYYNYGCSNDNMFVREDTTLGRIYLYNPYTNSEILMCDMSLEVGDTFVLNNEYTLVVDSVHYFNGKKVIYLTYLEDDIFFWFQSWIEPSTYPGSASIVIPMFIEGVGPSYGCYYGVWFQYQPGFLLCIHQNDSLYYMADPYLGCSQSPQVGITDQTQEVFAIYPNPTTEYINILINDSESTNGEFYIADLSGRIVQRFPANDCKCTLKISFLPTGYYTIIYNNSKKLSSKPFVKL